MSDARMVHPLPVLTEESVWPEFASVLAALGDSWRAPSGRIYELAFDGRTLTVSLVSKSPLPEPPPPAGAIDDDLFELACALQEAVGGEWSAEGLRRSAAIFGWRSREQHRE